MPGMSGDPQAPPASQAGEHERRLAIGTISQQGAQAIAFVSMLAVVTVLGRRLPLTEFGTYGLFASLSTYLLFAQNSVETAAVKLLAPAENRLRDRIFTTAVMVYTAAGLLAGVVVALAGLLLPGPLGVPDALQGDVRLGAGLTGLLMLVGWPLKANRDLLRASDLYRRAAAADALGFIVMAALSVGLALADAPLWALLAAAGTVPAVTGSGALGFLVVARAHVKVEPSLLERATTREFLKLAWQLLVIGATELVVYGLDRVILAAFRSPATVGLYEGPVRAHNLVRVITGALGFTVLPAAAQYEAAGDVTRTEVLLVRGTRYVLALIVPIVTVLILLAGPILELWLGPRFAEGQWALIILVSYWYLNANTIVAGGMLVAHGHAGWLVRYSWAGAALSLTLSLILTPLFGLEGVALGTTVGYVLMFPLFMYLTLRALPVGLGSLARQAWVPAYSVAALLAALLGAVRVTTDVEGWGAVLALAAGGLALYWLVYYVAWLRPEERTLIGAVLRGILRAD
jgi:O-antigen/teichoic acid export membrane protein